MKKISEIMDELGFHPEGSDEVKKAFIKNLIKQAQACEYQPLSEEEENAQKNQEVEELQTSLFDQKRSG